MPEPTTTRLQEWNRISLKIVCECSYEKITREEIKFIQLTYDRTNEQIHSWCHTIQTHTFEVMQDMIKKNDNKRLNINERIDILIKLYSAIIVWIPIAILMNIGTCETRQRLINISANKILELKIAISCHLPETNPEVIRLYDIFDRFNQDIVGL
jgi:hypothetical protein